MEKFIYVFSLDDKETLLTKGYNLLKSDELNHIYIFENKSDFCFSENNMKFVYSDVLTF